mmetsp:Transcript_124552/g.398762  ORF Transcript_124552/g.398762 Transcript_124552/m.398762 type:complete len:446 (-) Transcript_124552:772-2109(-)
MVLPNEHVVVVELILDDVSRPHPVVRAVGQELVAAGPICQEAIRVPLDLPGVLVVEVEPETEVVMEYVAANRPKRRVHWAHLPCSLALTSGSVCASSPNSIFHCGHAILNEVVRHADQVDACLSRRFALPRRGARQRPRRADNDVAADRVVHFVAVLGVDANTKALPNDVVVDQGVVCAMDRDGCLSRVDDGVALVGARGALPDNVKMDAVPSHEVPLPAVFQTSIAHVHDALVEDGSVEALQGPIEILGVAGDQDRPLEVDHLCRHLELVTLELLDASLVELMHGLLEVDHARNRLVQLTAVDLDFPDAKPCPSRLRVPTFHACVISLDADGGNIAPLATLVGMDLDPAAPQSLRVSELHPGIVGVRSTALDGILGCIPGAIPIDQDLRDVGGVLEEHLNPLLLTGAPVPSAPTAPIGVGHAIHRLRSGLVGGDVLARRRMREA